MNTITKLSLASALALFVAAPALAQNPQQSDYYRPSQMGPQQMSPGQEQLQKQGDYYKPYLDDDDGRLALTCVPI